MYRNLSCTVKISSPCPEQGQTVADVTMALRHRWGRRKRSWALGVQVQCSACMCTVLASASPTRWSPSARRMRAPRGNAKRSLSHRNHRRKRPMSSGNDNGLHVQEASESSNGGVNMVATHGNVGVEVVALILVSVLAMLVALTVKITMEERK